MVKETLKSVTGKRVYGKKVFTFLAFLALATIVWFVNELSSEYVSDYYCQLHTQNSANKREQRYTTTEPMDIKVKTRGYILVHNRITIPVIDIDTKNYRVYADPSQENSYYVVLNNALRNEITNKIDQNIKIEAFPADTVFLSLLTSHNQP